jgi:3-oxoacyl-[acyl-carrier protein] reductase
MSRRFSSGDEAMTGDGKLTGKVAVVTGASSGIGRASAKLFAKAGARVVVGYNRGADRANAVVAELAGSGQANFHRAMHLPLEDTAQINKVAAAVREEFGRCDILVNSAGFTRMVAHSDLDALTDDLIDQVLTANVRGPFATIRAFAPLLKASGDGVIINISSGAAQRGSGSSIIYGASKAALDTMSMALARVLGPEIRVVVVAPGMVHTGFVPGRTEEAMLKAATATPLKRQIEAEDVALAVLSCVTHLKFTTGSIVNVNGGGHL